MLQVFYLDVAYVALAIHVCCTSVFSNVSVVSSGCCMFSSGCCICYSGYTHMLQEYVLNILSVFRRMLQQVFHVAIVCESGS